MNLGEIEASLYDQLGFATTPESAITRRLQRHINTAHREILTMRGTSILRRAVLSFTTTLNVPLVALPQAAVHISVITDRTNGFPLEEISIADLRYRDPRQNFTSATPDGYVVVGYSLPFAAEPTAPTQLYVTSDNAADGVGTSVFIEGIITGGYTRRAQVAMNGVTPVAVDASAAWEHITKFYISSAASGNVTLTQGLAGAELARIPLGHTYARYTVIQMSPTPASAVTYYADVERSIQDMLAPKDEPLLPEDFSYLLEAAALRVEYKKREKMSLWQIENDRWKAGISNLKTWCARKSGVGVSGQRGEKGRRISQLGSNFPAGS